MDMNFQKLDEQSYLTHLGWNGRGLVTPAYKSHTLHSANISGLVSDKRLGSFYDKNMSDWVTGCPIFMSLSNHDMHFTCF